MKLSEKGKRKILDNRYWFSEEFDQGDFEGMVCLTVDESKMSKQSTQCENVSKKDEKTSH